MLEVRVGVPQIWKLVVNRIIKQHLWTFVPCRYDTCWVMVPQGYGSSICGLMKGLRS